MTSGGTLLIALLLQGPTGASGGAPDAPSTRARLELRGAGECISRGDLAARVGARTPRIQFVDDAAIYAQVTLTSARPGNVIAELVLAAPGNDQPSRRFVARSCAEAADAIALIIAVTLDPTLKRTGAIAPGGASGTTEAGTDRAPPAEKPGAEPAPPPPAPPAAVESVPPPAPGPAIETRRQFAATIAGQTIFGPAPGVLPGIALYGMAALERDGIWAPALFIGATRVWRNDLSQPGGAASFILDAASLDACPLRVGVSRLVARPCASALLGRLAATGGNTAETFSSARPFATAGVALAASFGTTIEVSARVAVGLTLIRDWYDFDGVVFHRASPITVAANLGVGLRWP